MCSSYWSGEPIVAERKDVQGSSQLAVHRGGRLAALAGRLQTVLLDLDRPTATLATLAADSKYEVSALQWSRQCGDGDTLLLAIAYSHQLTILQCVPDGGVIATSTTATVASGGAASASMTQVARNVAAHRRHIADLDWHWRRHQLLATCSVDGSVAVWDVRARQWRRPAIALTSVESANQVKWNRVSDNILASSHEGDIRVWDIRQPAAAQCYVPAHAAKIHGLDWSPWSETEIATASQDMYVKFVDISQPRAIVTMPKSRDPLWRARYTPFGRAFVTEFVLPNLRRGDNSLCLWSRDNLTDPVHTFVGHSDVVLEFDWRYRPDDDEYDLVTWSRDQSLRLWQVERHMLQLCGHQLQQRPHSPPAAAAAAAAVSDGIGCRAGSADQPPPRSSSSSSSQSLSSGLRTSRRASEETVSDIRKSGQTTSLAAPVVKSITAPAAAAATTAKSAGSPVMTAAVASHAPAISSHAPCPPRAEVYSRAVESYSSGVTGSSTSTCCSSSPSSSSAETVSTSVDSQSAQQLLLATAASHTVLPRGGATAAAPHHHSATALRRPASSLHHYIATTVKSFANISLDEIDTEHNRCCLTIRHADCLLRVVISQTAATPTPTAIPTPTATAAESSSGGHGKSCCTALQLRILDTGQRLTPVERLQLLHSWSLSCHQMSPAAAAPLSTTHLTNKSCVNAENNNNNSGDKNKFSNGNGADGGCSCSVENGAQTSSCDVIWQQQLQPALLQLAAAFGQCVDGKQLSPAAAAAAAAGGAGGGGGMFPADTGSSLPDNSVLQLPHCATAAVAAAAAGGVSGGNNGATATSTLTLPLKSPASAHQIYTDRRKSQQQGVFASGNVYSGFRDMHVPFPRTSGARFCSNGVLCVFACPMYLKRLSTRGESVTPRSLSALDAYLVNYAHGPVPRPLISSGSLIYALSDSSSVSDTSFGPKLVGSAAARRSRQFAGFGDDFRMTGPTQTSGPAHGPGSTSQQSLSGANGHHYHASSSVSQAAAAAAAFVGTAAAAGVGGGGGGCGVCQQLPSPSGGPPPPPAGAAAATAAGGRGSQAQLPAVVMCYDVTRLMLLDRTLALRCAVAARSPDQFRATCSRNAACAVEAGRADLEKVWLALAVCAESAADRRPAAGDVSAQYELARRLVDDLLTHYLRVGDIQTVATVVCNLAELTISTAATAGGAASSDHDATTGATSGATTAGAGGVGCDEVQSAPLDSVVEGKRSTFPTLGDSPYHTIHPPDRRRYPTLFSPLHVMVPRQSRSNSWTDDVTSSLAPLTPAADLAPDWAQAALSSPPPAPPPTPGATGPAYSTLSSPGGPPNGARLPALGPAPVGGAYAVKLALAGSHARLLDPAKYNELENYIRVYGEILFRWNLLLQRAKVLKFSSSVVVQPRYGVDVACRCSRCGHTAPGPVCPLCRRFSVTCTLCRLPVRGVAVFCLSCGHGGHLAHVQQWFRTRRTCPVGCQCVCVDKFGRLFESD